MYNILEVPFVLSYFIQGSNEVSGIKRRDLLKPTSVFASSDPNTSAHQAAVLQFGGQSIAPPETPIKVSGEVFEPKKTSNPLAVKIITFTTVSSNVDESIKFYRDVIGMRVFSDERLPDGMTTAPGIGNRQRRHVLLTMPDSPYGQAVRILEAPANSAPIRPRPNSGPNDPGLLVMEGGSRDITESYHVVANAKAPMISSPRYYYFRNTMWHTDIDVMSYAPFGPGGEQLFITASIRSDQKLVRSKEIHSGFGSASITCLDQRPVNKFFEEAFSLQRTSQMECYQDNVNELVGAPAGSYFLWGSVGAGVALEVWEFKAKSGRVYPCRLDKTGLAMLTFRVNNLSKCRSMCIDAGIEIVGEGALPNPENKQPDGFTVRGAVGELYEVVQA